MFLKAISSARRHTARRVEQLPGVSRLRISPVSEFYNYSSFLTGQFQTEVRAALAAWEAVANIDFVEVADSKASNLRFGFVNDFPAIGSSPAIAGGPGGTAGQAHVFYDSNTIHDITDADIAFDAQETWLSTARC